MVDKTRYVEPGKLTAYERWELPNIGANKPVAKKVAQSNSPKVKLPTAQDIENIRKQAYEEGLEQGKKAGYDQGHKEGIISGKEEGEKQGLAQGLQQGQAQVNDVIKRLENLCAELINPLSKQQSLVEEAMLNISMAVARSVIHKELQLDPGSIKNTICSIFNELPKADQGFSIYIHSKDESFVRPILEDLKSTVSLKLDDSLTPGGFLVHSTTQLIDFTIEKRFQKVVQAMLNQALQKEENEHVAEIPSTISALSDYSADTLTDDRPESNPPESENQE